MKKLLLFIATLLPQLILADELDTLRVDDGYVRGLPPGVANTAAYMTLRNDSAADLTLTGAETDVAESVSIHATVHEDGLMKMKHQMSLSIPAGGAVVLESGGLHLMLMGLKNSRLGAQVEMQLRFSGGDTKTVLLPVISVLDE